MPKDKDPGIPKPKKEGWKDRTKEFKVVIVKDAKFDGILFTVGHIPLRKIGIETAGIVIAGMPNKVVVNASYKQAPRYRLIITEKGYKLYTKGIPSILIN